MKSTLFTLVLMLTSSLVQARETKIKCDEVLGKFKVEISKSQSSPTEVTGTVKLYGFSREKSKTFRINFAAPFKSYHLLSASQDSNNSVSLKLPYFEFGGPHVGKAELEFTNEGALEEYSLFCTFKK